MQRGKRLRPRRSTTAALLYFIPRPPVALSVSIELARALHPNTASCVAVCLSSPAHIPPSENIVIPLFPPLGALSALSEVGEALGRCEGVGLQGEEVLLRQEEPGALRGHGGLVELELGVGGGVLDAS